MKGYFLGLVLLMGLTTFNTNGQSLNGFYNSLPKLNLPYSFNYEIHKHNSETDLLGSIKSQDVMLQDFKAVARIDIADNYYFIIVKKIYEEDFDNLFLLLALNKEGKITDSLPIDIKAEDNKGVDFSISVDKVIKIADIHLGQAEVSTYSFSNGKFVKGAIYNSVSTSELSSQ